ncbi:hypothetical protein U1Q18_051633 [Sarracenia purpurea var. burkii]
MAMLWPELRATVILFHKREIVVPVLRWLYPFSGASWWIRHSTWSGRCSLMARLCCRRTSAGRLCGWFGGFHLICACVWLLWIGIEALLWRRYRFACEYTMFGSEIIAYERKACGGSSRSRRARRGSSRSRCDFAPSPARGGRRQMNQQVYRFFFFFSMASFGLSDLPETHRVVNLACVAIAGGLGLLGMHWAFSFASARDVNNALVWSGLFLIADVAAIAGLVVGIVRLALIGAEAFIWWRWRLLCHLGVLGPEIMLAAVTDVPFNTAATIQLSQRYHPWSTAYRFRNSPEGTLEDLFEDVTGGLIAGQAQVLWVCPQTLEAGFSVWMRVTPPPAGGSNPDAIVLQLALYTPGAATNNTLQPSKAMQTQLVPGLNDGIGRSYRPLRIGNGGFNMEICPVAGSASTILRRTVSFQDMPAGGQWALTVAAQTSGPQANAPVFLTVGYCMSDNTACTIQGLAGGGSSSQANLLTQLGFASGDPNNPTSTSTTSSNNHHQRWWWHRQEE